MAYTIKPLQWTATSKDRHNAQGIKGTYNIAPNDAGGYTWFLPTYKCETGFETVEAAKISAAVDHAKSLLPFLERC